MFIHNIDPTLFTIGPFEIRFYGIVYVIGFILAYFVLEYYRKKGRLKLDKDGVYDLLFYIMLGVLIGSRLFEVLVWDLNYYIAHPIEILKFWRGGMAYHGGLIGIVIAGWLFCRKHKLNIAEVADMMVIPAVFILALGRIANFINGEIYGPITDLPWCVKFPNVDGCRHPAQLYGFLKRTMIGFILIILNRKPHKPGYLFWMMMLLFGAGRFVLNFWREDPLYWGLSIGQYASAVMVIIAGYVLVGYYWWAKQ